MKNYNVKKRKTQKYFFFKKTIEFEDRLILPQHVEYYILFKTKPPIKSYSEDRFQTTEDRFQTTEDRFQTLNLDSPLLFC